MVGRNVTRTKWSFPNRVVIAPCTGVGQTAGTISRSAAYRVVEELCPDETCLLCLPAYNIGVEEDEEMVRQNPGRIIAIEGCANLCMTKLLETKGYPPSITIMIPKIAAKRGLTLDIKKNRAHLSEVEERIASAVAEEVAAGVESLKPR